MGAKGNTEQVGFPVECSMKSETITNVEEKNLMVSQAV